jgi:hypothetical protein
MPSSAGVSSDKARSRFIGEAMFFALPLLLAFVQDAKDTPPAAEKRVDVSIELTIIKKQTLDAPQPAKKESFAPYITILERQHVAAMAVNSAKIGNLKSFVGVANPVDKVMQSLAVRVNVTGPDVITLSFSGLDVEDGKVVLNAIVGALRDCLGPKDLLVWVLSAPRQRMVQPARP